VKNDRWLKRLDCKAYGLRMPLVTRTLILGHITVKVLTSSRGKEYTILGKMSMEHFVEEGVYHKNSVSTIIYYASWSILLAGVKSFLKLNFLLHEVF